jgi:feruloyl esterase
MMHGLADEVISPNPTIAYYKDQVSKLGQASVDTFIRFYTVPGFGHGSGAFNVAWDALGALDRWVNAGLDPGDSLVVTDTNGATFGRSRPLCAYPKFPKFSGVGSAYLANGFTCASS